MAKANPELKRKIQEAIKLFFKINSGNEFYGWQLDEYVRKEVYVGKKYQDTIRRYASEWDRDWET